VSPVQDEHWCPSPMGGFQEDHDHIGSHTFWSTGEYAPAGTYDWSGDDSWKRHPAVVALAGGTKRMTAYEALTEALPDILNRNDPAAANLLGELVADLVTSDQHQMLKAIAALEEARATTELWKPPITVALGLLRQAVK
jgi:hypothetical protein